MAGPPPLWPLSPTHLPIPSRCPSLPPSHSPPNRPSLSTHTHPPAHPHTLALPHSPTRIPPPLTPPPLLPPQSLLCFFFTINTSLYVFGEFATLVACPSCCPFDPADNIAGVPAAYLPNRCMAPIDIVYTWVNGSDPIWAERMRHFKRLHSEGKVQRRRLLGRGNQGSRRGRGRRGGALRSPAPSKGPKGFDDDLADLAADPAVISPSPSDVAPNATLFHLLAAALSGDPLGGSAESDPPAADFFSGVNWNPTMNNSVGCGGNGSNGSNCTNGTNGTNGSTAGGHVRILHHSRRRPTLTGPSTTHTHTHRARSSPRAQFINAGAVLAFTGKCYAPSRPHRPTVRSLRSLLHCLKLRPPPRLLHPLYRSPRPPRSLCPPDSPLCSAPFPSPSHLSPSPISLLPAIPRHCLKIPPSPRPHPRTRTPRGTA